MKAMKDAVEFQQAAPPGRYPSRIIAAEAGFSKKGETMLHLTSEIIAPPQYAGQQADDYIGTDGTTKWGGFSKGRLAGLLGIQAVSTNDEIPDAQIAQNLLNRVYEIEYANEPRMTRTVVDGPYDKEMTTVDSRTGLNIILMKLIPKAYHAVNVAPQIAPSQAQQYAQAPQQNYAPQQVQQPQYAPQGLPAQQYAQPQFAPQQYAQPQFAPQAQQLAPQQQIAPPQGQMPWQQPPANGVAPQQVQPEAAPAKRGRKAASAGDAE